jgi:hypothetical protein
MKTISEDYFIRHFVEISQKLTSAELRMLYLLINEQDVIELSQQEFGLKIKAHRRTINIGLKKLKKLDYIRDIGVSRSQVSNSDDKNSNIQLEESIKNVPKIAVGRIKRYIIESFLNYYSPSNDSTIIVNEDYFSFVLRDWAVYTVYKNLKNKKLLITKTIMESYPNSVFHFKRDQSTYASESHFNITNHINDEINRVRKSSGYSVKKDKLLRYLYDTFLISENEVLKVINEDFPNLFIDGNRIKIPNSLMVINKNSQRRRQIH